MRLFVAIPLPDDVVKKLQSLTTPLRGLKCTDSEQYHLTLRFIGDVSESREKEIGKVLAAINHQAFGIEINGFGFFPGQRNQRVFWAAVEPNPELLSLQDKVEKACRSAGVDPEERDFIPHITLAKIKKRPEALDAYLKENEDFHIDSIRLKAFNLYQSRLKKHKAVHTAIRSFELE